MVSPNPRADARLRRWRQIDNPNRSFLVPPAVGIIVAIHHGHDEITNFSSVRPSVGSEICAINQFFSFVTAFNSG